MYKILWFCDLYEVVNHLNKYNVPQENIVFIEQSKGKDGYNLVYYTEKRGHKWKNEVQ